MNHSPSRPPRAIALYISTLSVIFVLLLFHLYTLGSNVSYSALDIFFWGCLLIWVTTVEVKLPFSSRISHSYIVGLGSLAIFPAFIPPLLLAVFRFKRFDESYPWYKDWFNRVQHGIASGLAALVWHHTVNLEVLRIGSVDLGPLLGITLASGLYYLSNIGAVTYAIHLASGVSIKKVWLQNFSWLSGSYIILGLVALFLSRAYQEPLVGNWGGFTVLAFILLLYFSRFYWDEKVKLEDSFNATIDTLVQALDAKDTFTRLHSERVAAIATDLAQAKGLDEADRRKIAYGARIHDIGKVGIPDDVLLKPIRLSSQEFELIKSHTTRGVEILKPAARYFKEVLPIVLYHHERWDGRGYPEGRAGDAIPLWARIVCIADAYEAMTAGRSYSPPKSPQRAMQELEDLAGDQFDPELVKLFKRIWLQDPIWKDREVFLRSYTSPVPLSELPLPSRSESASVITQELN